jgi:hypothetical protein
MLHAPPTSFSIITAFRRAKYWFLSWSRWIQAPSFHHIYLRSVLIVDIHIRRFKYCN